MDKFQFARVVNIHFYKHQRPKLGVSAERGRTWASGLTEINQLPAVTGVPRIVDRGREIYLFLAWITKDDLVYQVLGAAPASRWDQHRLRFEAAAKSFHQLSEAELREVHASRRSRVDTGRTTPHHTRLVSSARWGLAGGAHSP